MWKLKQSDLWLSFLRAFPLAPLLLSKQIYATQSYPERFPKGPVASVQVIQTTAFI